MKANIAAGIAQRGPSTGKSWLLLLALLAAGGCQEPELETYYGRQQPSLATASVNGTDVLAGMFSEAGHTVTSRRVLVSSDMWSVDTIVWIPDDFAAPSAEVCRWFDEWLSQRDHRTLIYVGRNFDAAAVYWRKMTPLASPDQQADYRARALRAAVLARPLRAPSDAELTCDWFDFKKETAREARELAGPWSSGIDPAKTDVELVWRLVPHDAHQALLTSENEVIEVIVAQLQRPQWNKSQLIMVANGSFLLNLPLVNHEHRKLAGKLIESTKAAGRVVFLESGRSGPSIDPPATDNSLWRALGAWPLDTILLHFAVLGVIFCFARWPIFGRPQIPPSPVIADFGRHVDAVGELLRRTRDRDYAQTKLQRGD